MLHIVLYTVDFYSTQRIAVSKGSYAYNALLYVDVCSTTCCRSDSAHVYAAHADTEGHARVLDIMLLGLLGRMRTSSESLPEFWRGLMAGLSEATSAVTHICAHAMALSAWRPIRAAEAHRHVTPGA